MKSFLLNGFEDFITGSGIWILVGCLAFALLVSVLFLILNIEKEKKMREKNSTPIILTKEEAPKAERIQPVEVKVSKVEEEKVEEPKEETKVEEEKPAKKAPAKKSAAKTATKKATEENKEVEPKTTAKKTTTKKVAEEKKEVEPKATKKAAPKKEEKEVVKEEPAQEGGNYDISYDAESKQWVVKRESNARATKRTKTKQQAIDYAKPLAEKYEVKLIVHTKKD
ncbi:MAG: DUF2188 domain-containing protein [Firmicutes bacterium]|nr:DUF2188 domain-containing protein [Bacillota bacterium]